MAETEHPALKPSYGISTDIYPGVYDWFYIHDVFQRWRDSRMTWQLHCLGGPGAGKTTLTALATEHLRTHSSAKQHPIVSIFINQDVSNRDTYIIEDLLRDLYHRLAEGRYIEGDQSDEAYEEYEENRLTVPEGSRIRLRLSLIRKATHVRLEALQDARAFLLLDGIDRCESTLRLMLEEELSQLLDAGLSIMVTSRLAVFEQAEGRCDHTNHGDRPSNDKIPQEDREVLDIFLVCKGCGRVLCYPCKGAGRHCELCHDDSELYYPLDHVNTRVSIPEPAMKNFIAWSLEREHGDLGLGSSARKPPLSPLGKSLSLDTASKSIQKHADDVLEFSYGHIGIAKARLDVLHEMESLDKLETRKDQLPSSIVALFNAGLKHINAQDAGQRKLALHALAAAAKVDFGLPVRELRDKVEDLTGTKTRSGEEILEATRGFLMAITEGTLQNLTVFNQNLLYYVEQRYHTDLHRASVQLNAPRARWEPQNIPETPTRVTPRNIARSVTGLPTIPEGPPPRMIIKRGTRVW